MLSTESRKVFTNLTTCVIVHKTMLALPEEKGKKFFSYHLFPLHSFQLPSLILHHFCQEKERPTSPCPLLLLLELEPEYISILDWKEGNEDKRAHKGADNLPPLESGISL